jgi:predicted nucleotidyltransferase
VTDPVLARYADRIREIARRHGARRLRVFGSLAREAGSSGSDLDLLAEFEPGRSLLDLVALKQEVEEVTGCSVDVATEDSLSPYLKGTVRREARDL